MVLKINLCASDEKTFMALEWRIEEEEWPSGKYVGLAIRRSRVRFSLWPLAGLQWLGPLLRMPLSTVVILPPVSTSR